MHKRTWPFYGGMRLMLEVQQVIGLRMMKLAMGGKAAEAEAKLMVDEKVSAAGEAVRLMGAGVARGDGIGGSADTVQMLRRKVHANRKRLTGGK